MTDGPSHTRPPGPDRRAIVISGIGLAALAALILLSWLRPWSRLGPPPVKGHWEAVRRGRFYLDQGRPDLALRAVSQIRDEAPGSGEAMCVAGLALARMEQFRSARIALERALRLQPRQPMAAKALAALHLSMGNSVRGLDSLRKAAELAPTDFRPWFTMGQVYFDLGETEKAAEAYREATRRNDRDVDSRLGLIETLLALGRGEEAGRVVHETLALEPDRPRLLGLAARHARDSGRDGEALALADRALALDPDETEALYVRAHLRHAAGQPDRALADVERAVALNPNQLSGLNLLAQVESRLGLHDRAAKTVERRHLASERLARMDALTQEIASRPDDPEPRWRLGLAAVEGNQSKLARNCFQAALALDPNYQPARDSLAALDSAAGPGPGRGK